jgi:hypothetical protein
MSELPMMKLFLRAFRVAPSFVKETGAMISMVFNSEQMNRDLLTQDRIRAVIRASTVDNRFRYPLVLDKSRLCMILTGQHTHRLSPDVLDTFRDLFISMPLTDMLQLLRHETAYDGPDFFSLHRIRITATMALTQLHLRYVRMTARSTERFASTFVLSVIEYLKVEHAEWDSFQAVQIFCNALACSRSLRTLIMHEISFDVDGYKELLAGILTNSSMKLLCIGSSRGVPEEFRKGLLNSSICVRIV